MDVSHLWGFGYLEPVHELLTVWCESSQAKGKGKKGTSKSKSYLAAAMQTRVNGQTDGLRAHGSGGRAGVLKTNGVCVSCLLEQALALRALFPSGSFSFVLNITLFELALNNPYRWCPGLNPQGMGALQTTPHPRICCLIP